MKKLNELVKWEQQRDRDNSRERYRLENFAKKKQQLIEEDLNYDSTEERRREKRNPKEYQRQ